MKPEETWTAYWAHAAPGPGYDVSSREIFKHLRAAAGPCAGKKTLECGSGTGKISALIARDGGAAHLLDYAPRALELSKQFFAAQKLRGSFTEASIFSIPFSDGSFDIVWNAGVLEHFPFEQQCAAMREMKRVCADGGLVMAINPFSRGYIYRLGKWFAERQGRWPYGDEFPMPTIRPLADAAGMTIVNEYSFGFHLQLNFLQYVPAGSFVRTVLTHLLSESRGHKLANGYLLMSVLRKNDGKADAVS